MGSMWVSSLGGGEEAVEDEGGKEDEDSERDEEWGLRARDICVSEEKKNFEGGRGLVARDGAGSRKAADGDSEARARRRKRKGKGSRRRGRATETTTAPAIRGGCGFLSKE